MMVPSICLLPLNWTIVPCHFFIAIPMVPCIQNLGLLRLVYTKMKNVSCPLITLQYPYWFLMPEWLLRIT